MIRCTSVIAFFSFFIVAMLRAQDTSVPTIYVDDQGVMRWSDTRQEAAFYGVNYCLPFAHGYRAIDYLGKDHKQAIDRDVYHFTRLGFNAYRIHVWDVEITDSVGNLLENEHLDLLDYLISKLRERGIRTVITCQTDFGNGYPERNRPTGGFSYLYDKCDVHSNPDAVRAQERYVSQFIQHKNPYTGFTYRDDPYVVGFEINNEPCHTGDPAQTRTYINRMLAAIKQTGNMKPVFYNVSHNMDHVGAYFNTAIQGATYQWYPIGLVAGFTRKGNFLPYLDQYEIPFSSVEGFGSKAKIVYEFDPADAAYTYLYPAMARTFRSQGFQWITQFAYDPIDLARYNTDYQTHYLNLAYTPGKAISMKIAAEVTRRVDRGESFGSYPADTLFGDFLVSHKQDLSVLNSEKIYLNSNHTTERPVAPEKLATVAGCGSSPIVDYAGTGAYFLDQLEPGVWRLEVMPDAVPIADQFAKPSLSREAVTIAWNRWPMRLRLPDLTGEFHVVPLGADDVPVAAHAEGGALQVTPGVYLLCRPEVVDAATRRWQADTRWHSINLGEFVAPEAHAAHFSVVHTPATVVTADESLTIRATVVGPSLPDSVVLHTDRVSFWSANNPRVLLKHGSGYRYEGNLPREMVKQGVIRYTMTVYAKGQATTFPDNRPGTPLDWDYPEPLYWTTQVVPSAYPVVLLDAAADGESLETYAMPEWGGNTVNSRLDHPAAPKAWRYTFAKRDSGVRFFWKRYVADVVANRRDRLADATYLCVALPGAHALDSLSVGLTTGDGYTYRANIALDGAPLVRIPLSTLQLGDTPLLPAPYPVFLERYFSPTVQRSFDVATVESLVLHTLGEVASDASLTIGNVWLE